MTNLNPHDPDHNAVLQRMAGGATEQQAREHVAQTLSIAAQQQPERAVELHERADNLDGGHS